MPVLSKKQKSISTPEPKKNKLRESKVGVKEVSPEIVEVEQSEELEIKEEIMPFSDGLVTSSFCIFPLVAKIADEEVGLLRLFLKYFSQTEPFIGTMNTKTSFMKKKGGRLL